MMDTRGFWLALMQFNSTAKLFLKSIGTHFLTNFAAPFPIENCFPRMVKKILKSSITRRSTDLLLSPLTLISAIWYKYVRTGKASSMPITENILMRVGVLPINDHYYQPLIN